MTVLNQVLFHTRDKLSFAVNQRVDLTFRSRTEWYLSSNDTVYNALAVLAQGVYQKTQPDESRTVLVKK